MSVGKATILREDAALRAATWEGVFFEVWRGSGTPAHFRELAALQVAYAKAQPDGKYAHVAVVRLSMVTGFDGESRRAVEERTRATDARVRASAVVLPTPGFAASLVRGIITGMTLLKTSRPPTKVSASYEEALAWLARQLPARGGQRVTAGELAAVCASLVE